MQIASANVIYPQRWNYLGIGPEIAKSLVDSGLSPFAQMGANRLGHAIFGNTIAEDQVAQNTREATENATSAALVKGAHAAELSRINDRSEEENQYAIDHPNSVQAIQRSNSQAGAVVAGRSDTVETPEAQHLLESMGANKTPPPGPEVAPPADPTVKVMEDGPASPTSDLFGTPDATPKVPQTGATDPLVTVRPDSAPAPTPRLPPPAVNPAESLTSPPSLQTQSAASNAMAQAQSPASALHVATSMQDPDVRKAASLYMFHNKGLMSQIGQTLKGELDPNDAGRSDMMANITKASFNSFLDTTEAKTGMSTANYRALGPAGAAKMAIATQSDNPSYMKYLYAQDPVKAAAFYKTGQGFKNELAPVLARMGPFEGTLIQQQSAGIIALGDTGLKSAQEYAQLDYNQAQADRVKGLLKGEIEAQSAETKYKQAGTALVGAQTGRQLFENKLAAAEFPYTIATAALDPQYKKVALDTSIVNLKEQEAAFPYKIDAYKQAARKSGYEASEAQAKMAVMRENIAATMTKSYLAPQIAASQSTIKQLDDNTKSLVKLNDDIRDSKLKLASMLGVTEEAKKPSIDFLNQLELDRTTRMTTDKTLRGQLQAYTQKIGESNPEKQALIDSIFDPAHPEEKVKSPLYWGQMTGGDVRHFPGPIVGTKMDALGSRMAAAKQVPTLQAFQAQYGKQFNDQFKNDPAEAYARMNYAYKMLQASYEKSGGKIIPGR